MNETGPFTLTLFGSLPFITLCPVIHKRGGKLEASGSMHVWHAGFPYFYSDIHEVGDEFAHFIQVSQCSQQEMVSMFISMSVKQAKLL